MAVQAVRLVLVVILVQFSFSSPLLKKIWRCTGPQSKYSFLDCKTDHSYSDGCYYVEHFSQFRPCAWICDDIEFNSIAEEKCRAFCSGYFTKSCHLETITTTTVASSTSTWLGSPITLFARDLSTPESNAVSPRIYFAATGVCVLVVVFVIVGVGIHFLRPKVRRRSVNETFFIPISETADARKFELTIPSQPEEFQKAALVENGVNEEKEHLDAACMSMMPK